MGSSSNYGRRDPRRNSLCRPSPGAVSSVPDNVMKDAPRTTGGSTANSTAVPETGAATQKAMKDQPGTGGSTDMPNGTMLRARSKLWHCDTRTPAVSIAGVLVRIII